MREGEKLCALKRPQRQWSRENRSSFGWRCECSPQPVGQHSRSIDEPSGLEAAAAMEIVTEMSAIRRPERLSKRTNERTGKFRSFVSEQICGTADSYTWKLMQQAAYRENALDFTMLLDATQTLTHIIMIIIIFKRRYFLFNHKS